LRRAAFYLRVSTDEQTCDNQRHDLCRLAERRRLDAAAVYEEKLSAAKTRPELARMLRDAHAGRFEVLLIWALDRLGRSMVGNLQAVLDLDRRGVEVVSLTEPWLDTGGPVRALLIAIFGWVAEQERVRLGERTKAGLARAKRDGIRLGRPATRIDLAVARELQGDGLSVRAIAKRLKVPPSTLHRALAATASTSTPATPIAAPATDC
jgi:putative DNA-invertase from lambdoid prophage Rac